MKPRITWQDFEVEAMVEKIQELLPEKKVKLADFLAAASLAQETVLDEDRRRSLLGVTSVQKLLDQMPQYNVVSSRGRNKATVEEVSEVQDTPTPFDVMLDAAADRAMNRLLHRFADVLLPMLMAVKQEAAGELETEVKEPVAPAPVQPTVAKTEVAPPLRKVEKHTPTFVVLGLHPSQAEKLKQEFQGQAIIKAWLESEGTPKLEGMLNSADSCVAMMSTRRLGGQAIKAALRIQGLRYHPLQNGGVNAVADKISQLLGVSKQHH